MGRINKHRNDYLVDEVMRSAGASDKYMASHYIENEEPVVETINPETIEELIEYQTAEVSMEDDEFKTTINDVLDSLTPREAKVLRMRFGLDIPEECTLDQTGSMFSLTKERMRQIEAKALRKMRHPARSAYLQPLLNPDVPYQTPFQVLKEPPPDVNRYLGWYSDGAEMYHNAVMAWERRQKEAIATIKKAKESLGCSIT